MRNHDFDRAVDRLALRQHGAFHQRQLRQLGGSVTMVDDRVAAGRFIRLAARVLALPSHPATWRRQYKAAELSIPGAAIADRAALLLHGIDGAKVVRPQLVVPYTSNVRSELADVRRCSDVRTTEIDRIQVTTVAQTLVDLVGSWSLRSIEVAWDDALLTGKVTIGDLAERVEVAVTGRRPHGRAAQLLLNDRRETDWVALDSLLELLAGRLLAALPMGVRLLHQAVMPWWTPGEGRVDLYVPEWRLVIELDGRRWHARVAAFDADRWRDNVAAANGHVVLRFTHAHLTLRPDEVLALVLDVGRHRLALAG